MNDTSIFRRPWTILETEHFKLAPSIPYPDREYLAGTIYAASSPQIANDPFNVASVITNRAKELAKNPMEIISNGFTEVGRDSSKKFQPFLKKDYSKGTPDLVNKSYDLADKVLTNKLENPAPYNSFKGNGQTNDFYNQKLSKEAYANPEIIRNRFPQPDKFSAGTLPASISMAIPTENSMPFSKQK